ncbi:hypothetical protein ACFX15_001576 [Malus domestica]
MADDDGKLSIFSSNNEDIIVEILSWLPVICLLRFRCVCKSWGALISTPHFFDKHRPCTNDNDNNKNVLILFNRSPRRADYWESHDSLPSRFPQLTDYQSLKNKKNVAASASAATAASLSRRRNLEDEFPDDTSVRDSSLAGSCNGLICLLDVKWLMPIYHMEDDGTVLMRSSQGDFILYIPKEEEEEEEEDTCMIALDNPGIPSNPYFGEPDLTLEAVMYVETLVSPEQDAEDDEDQDLSLNHFSVCSAVLLTADAISQ